MLDTESQEAHAEWSWPLAVLQPLTHFGVLVPLAVLGFVAPRGPIGGGSGSCTPWCSTYAASTVAFYVFARYRYPLVPILMVFAAAAVTNLRAIGRSRARWPRRPLAAVAANWPMLSTGRMRAISETNLGVALFERGQTANAQARYRAALAIEPDYPPAYNNLGVALRAQGRVGEAIAVYEDGLRHRDDYPDLHYNLGNALSEMGRLAEAEAAFRRAIALEPDSAAAYRNLGNLLASQGRTAEGDGLPSPRPDAGARRHAGGLRPGNAAARGATVRRSRGGAQARGAAAPRPCGGAQQSRHRPGVAGARRRCAPGVRGRGRPEARSRGRTLRVVATDAGAPR